MSTIPTKPTREEVARAIVRAATLDDLETAFDLREAYLDAHPDDSDIREMGALLDALAATLAGKESGTAPVGAKE